MPYFLVWALVALLLGLWSTLVWAGRALVLATLEHAGTLGVGDWTLPEQLSVLLPTGVAHWLVGTLENLAPHLQAWVDAMPALSGGVSLLAWLAWGMGALLLLAVGLAGHVAVALWRKSSRSSAPASVTPVQ